MSEGETPAEAPLINIVGERVALGPLRRDLLPLYARWINDFAVTRTMLFPPGPMTLDAETAWYDGAATGEARSFTIYQRDGWRPIGTLDLRDIDHRNRTAEFGIMIGEGDARGKGFGTEATRLALDYAFTALGLNNVMLTVYEFNHAGRRAYEKAGFRLIGRRRQARRHLGRSWDVLFYDCLASEFDSPVLGAVFDAGAGRDDAAQAVKPHAGGFDDGR
ncbi:MAG TPA: GNAT family protein [Thermomicrobiales bacterium]|nr:GNAT family protein [Thermomicrobiales bacterium]